MAEADFMAVPARRPRAAATFPADLVFDGVSHAYGHTPSVRAVDLAIAPGEVLCLLGQSGCGKTTLLRLAAGVERPTGGSVRIGGREVAGPGVFVPPEDRGIGLVFQDYALFPHMTNLANVMFGLKTLGRAAAREEAVNVLTSLGMDRYADHYPHEISGGQQQRVALARAIAPRPGVLLMDEPYSGLDRVLRDQVRSETLSVLRETGATAVIVTHDPEEAMRMGDRIALMREGRLEQLGTSDDLFNEPRNLFVARFFSELDVFSLRVGNGRIDTPFGAIDARQYPAGQEVDVALRATSLRLVEAGQGVPARVLATRFLGEVDHIELAVGGVDHPVRVRQRGCGKVRRGQEVGVVVDDRDVLIFPK